MKKNTVKAFPVVSIAAILAALGMLTGPAAGYASTPAAHPVTPFRMEYGAGVLEGSISWNARSIHTTGSVNAVSAKKTAVFQGESPHCISSVETRTASVGDTRKFVVDIPCDAPGGITIAYVELWDFDNSYLHRAICTRNGCTIKD
ncbi:hypothetical protein [Amycolatopsis sp. NPDC051716]|jgi:hypothetical protein|uniref:hypothetical protein n=1 Tax=Amycolatopsis sp. NPDC051716 TaxID=3155804 RepID=UPI0034367E4D